ncbi:MAG: amidase family protein [Termitinemataceae bacterium]
MSHTSMTCSFPDYFAEWEAKIGAFIEYRDPATWGDRITTTPARAGLPFAVKDNIAVEGFGLTCASRLLEGYRAPYTATAVRRLMDAGAIPIGKTNMDEFGMGSSTDTSALKTTNTPWDVRRVAGGSSGGSAAAVAAGLVPFALGSDTGGSVRQPAAFCGVIGLKPTYGAVSRFGLVAYASSLETIGILADSVDRARQVFRIIAGEDPLDQTTIAARHVHGQSNGQDVPAIQAQAEQLLQNPPADHGGSPVLAVLSSESLEAALHSTVQKTEVSASLQDLLEPEVVHAYFHTIEIYRSLGYRIQEVSLPTLAYAVPAYYTIATAEASANLARFDGIRYGNRPEWAENPEDLIDKVRSRGFGDEVKLRILLGTFVLRSGFQDRYYLQAQRLRQAIQQDFTRLFVDTGASALLMPVFPTRAFGRGADSSSLSPFAQKAADIFTCSINLAGLPALAFPAAVEGGLPIGLQLVGSPFSEYRLLDMADEFIVKQALPHPAGYQNFWR